MEHLTRFVLPLVVKRFLHAEAKVENDLMRSRGIMNQFNIELDWNFTHSLTLSRALNLIVDRFQTNNTLIYSHRLLYNKL